MNQSIDYPLIELIVLRRKACVDERALLNTFRDVTSVDAKPGNSLAVELASKGYLTDALLAEIQSETQRYLEVLSELAVGFVDRQESTGKDVDSDESIELETLMESEGSSTSEANAGYKSDSNQPSGSSVLPSFRTDSPLPTSSRYRKDTAHAEGGLGRVWLASDQELNRQVALKEIQPAHADDPACRTRFLQEAEITGALEHPGIVPVYGLGSYADGRPYYAMKFVEGQTLKDAIDELFRTSVSKCYHDTEWMTRFRRLLNHFLDVCNTIEYAHSKSFIHRDIKPSNIMLGSFGETLVVDWGLAKSVLKEPANAQDEQAEHVGGASGRLSGSSGVELTILGTAVGTPAYMSPEQADGGKTADVGAASDQFSLGATLHHLLFGRPPGASNSSDERGPGLRRDASESLAVPAPLRSICQKAMDKDVEERYYTVRELARDVENWLGDLPVSAHHESIAEQAGRWIRRRTTLVVSSLVALILLTVAVVSGIAIRQAYQRQLAEQQGEQERQAETRRQQIRGAVESAVAAAKVEIQNSRFEPALEFLQTATTQAALDANVASEFSQIVDMQLRTQRLLEFYNFVEQAEELTFRDSSRRASILFQRALETAGVFQQLEWWNALPTEDLNSEQIHRIRRQTYRAMFLLTALRLKETIPADLDVAKMLQLESDASQASNQASLVLFDLLDAYRESQGAVLGRQFANERLGMLNQMLAGMTLRRKAIEWEPKNASDLYVIGAALGYMAVNTSDLQQGLFETVLGIENAETTAKTMLDQAAALQRDHYWTQLVRAFFEAQRGEFDVSQRSYAHAISLNPDHWIGHAWLGRDTLMHAVSLDVENPRRSQLIQLAARHLEKAVDLNAQARLAHTFRGNVLSWSDDPREAAASYLAGLSLQEPLVSIDDSVVELVDRQDLTMVSQWCHAREETFPEFALLSECVAWAEWILGNHDSASEAADRGLQRDPESRVGRLVKARVILSSGDLEQAEKQLSELCDDQPGWFHGWWAMGECLLAKGKLDLATAAFARASETSKAPWQALIAQRNIALVSIRQASELALAETQRAIEIAVTESLTELELEAAEHGLTSVVSALREYHQSMEPIGRLETEKSLKTAAIINGGFELGLSTGWGDTLETLDQPVWRRFGGSLSRAAVTTQFAQAGLKALAIEQEANPKSGAYGEMTQSFPVIANAPYRLSVWVRSEGTDAGAVSVLGDDAEILRIPPGSYDWQRIDAEIEPAQNQLTIRIRCQGKSTAWLDSIQLATR